MICAWKELLKILPEGLRRDVDKLGRNSLQELRLRLGKPPELVADISRQLTGYTITADDLSYCINAASRYSPWASDSIGKGYLTTAGGHRIGICGQAVVQSNRVQGIRSVSSLCIRVARDLVGISGSLYEKHGSLLIIGSPGCGKTTLLRDLARQIANRRKGSVSVVDERGELFPLGSGFDTGNRSDILTGCEKQVGIDMVLRSMGPTTIAVDEITAEADADALLRASCCGVDLLATAHANDLHDLRSRPIYRKLWDFELFQWVVILQRDKSWTVERVVK